MEFIEIGQRGPGRATSKKMFLSITPTENGNNRYTLSKGAIEALKELNPKMNNIKVLISDDKMHILIKPDITEKGKKQFTIFTMKPLDIALDIKSPRKIDLLIDEELGGIIGGI